MFMGNLCKKNDIHRKPHKFNTNLSCNPMKRGGVDILSLHMRGNKYMGPIKYFLP